MRYEHMRQFWGPGHNERFPDRAFVAALHETWPELIVRWENQWQRWTVLEIVAWKNRRGPRLAPVLTVQNQDGEYLPLDERVLAALHDRDTQALGLDPKGYLRRMKDERRRYIANRDRAAQNYLEDSVRDGVDYLWHLPEHKRWAMA